MNGAATHFTLSNPTLPPELQPYRAGIPLAPAVGECVHFKDVFGVKHQRGGYGQVTFDKKKWSAHILAWCVAGREQPPPPFILRHRCHNRWCVNVDHLQVGTPRDNNRDATEAGRATGVTLTEDQVVRTYRWSLFRITQAQSAALIGCTQPSISKTLREIWELETDDRSHRLTDEHRRLPKNRRPKYHPRRNLSLSLPGIEAAPKAKKPEIKRLPPVHRPRIDRAPAPTQGRLFE